MYTHTNYRTIICIAVKCEHTETFPLTCAVERPCLLLRCRWQQAAVHRLYPWQQWEAEGSTSAPGAVADGASGGVYLRYLHLPWRNTTSAQMFSVKFSKMSQCFFFPLKKRILNSQVSIITFLKAKYNFGESFRGEKKGKTFECSAELNVSAQTKQCSNHFPKIKVHLGLPGPSN